MSTLLPELDHVAVTCSAPGGRCGGVIVGTDAGAVHLGADDTVAWIPWSMGRHVVALAVDPSSSSVAIGTRTGAVAIVTLDGVALEVDLGSRVRSLAWSPFDGLLAACSQVGGLVVLDRDGRRRCARPADPRWRRVGWQTRQREAPLAVAGSGGVTWFEPIRDAEVRHDPMAGTATALAIDPTGPWTAVGGLAGDLHIIESDGEGETEVVGWPDPVELLAWIPGSGHVVVAGGDEVTLWAGGPPAPDGVEHDPEALALDGSRVTAIAAHGWLPRVAVGGEDGEVVVWDTVTGRSSRLCAVGAAVTTLTWDPSVRRTFVGTRQGGGWTTATKGPG